LAAKINEAWTHPRLREIGQAARCKVREFAPERVVQELLAYFEDVLSGKES
jgi:predicted GNAT family acetyltransferase